MEKHLKLYHYKKRIHISLFGLHNYCEIELELKPPLYTWCKT